ncbi:MAG: two-component system, response regulator [Fimbriimonadaceae bacterium]|jgi:two-component system response regulator|nr:two-component system, response regulator [Fimbriimonadaceae bacterium]
MDSELPLVLLVEDDPDDEVMVRRAMERTAARAELLVARSGPEALDLVLGDNFARVVPRLKLVFLDQSLPSLSGPDVLKAIRHDRRTRMIPIVMLTSSTDEDALAGAYESGANGYVRKPVDYNEFMKSLEKALAYWLGVNVPYPVPVREGLFFG